MLRLEGIISQFCCATIPILMFFILLFLPQNWCNFQNHRDLTRRANFELTCRIFAELFFSQLEDVANLLHTRVLQVQEEHRVMAEDEVRLADHDGTRIQQHRCQCVA